MRCMLLVTFGYGVSIGTDPGERSWRRYLSKTPYLAWVTGTHPIQSIVFFSRVGKLEISRIVQIGML